MRFSQIGHCAELTRSAQVLRVNQSVTVKHSATQRLLLTWRTTDLVKYYIGIVKCYTQLDWKARFLLDNWSLLEHVCTMQDYVNGNLWFHDLMVSLFLIFICKSSLKWRAMAEIPDLKNIYYIPYLWFGFEVTQNCLFPLCTRIKNCLKLETVED